MKLTARQSMRLFEKHCDLVISKKQAICKGGQLCIKGASRWAPQCWPGGLVLDDKASVVCSALQGNESAAGRGGRSRCLQHVPPPKDVLYGVDCISGSVGNILASRRGSVGNVLARIRSTASGRGHPIGDSVSAAAHSVDSRVGDVGSAADGLQGQSPE